VEVRPDLHERMLRRLALEVAQRRTWPPGVGSRAGTADTASRGLGAPRLARVGAEPSSTTPPIAPSPAFLTHHSGCAAQTPRVSGNPRHCEAAPCCSPAARLR
jgi:hypothetical protein